MSKIDFSKAPDSDFLESLFWLYDFDLSNGCDSKRMLFKEYCSMVLNNDNVITCNNPREVMLCKQVLRMCRGEASQQLFKGDWYDFDKESYEFYINEQYRAKPKKELIVPWEWIADDVYRVEVSEDGKVMTISTKYNNESIPLKLDLDGVDLPAIIDRPSEK